MNPWLTALIILSAVLIATRLNGQEPNIAFDKMQRLLSEDREVRASARRELVQERKEMISRLSSAIEENAQRTSNSGFVEDAMSVLGDIRATEAIDVLVKHIGYPETAKIDDRRFSPTMIRISASDAGFPAINVLVKIGEPCVDPLIKKIRTTENRDERIACVGVLKRLKTPFIRERMEKAATSSNGRERESLNEALQLFDEWLSPEERVKTFRRKLEEILEKDGSRP